MYNSKLFQVYFCLKFFKTLHDEFNFQFSVCGRISNYPRGQDLAHSWLGYDLLSNCDRWGNTSYREWTEYYPLGNRDRKYSTTQLSRLDL